MNTGACAVCQGLMCMSECVLVCVYKLIFLYALIHIPLVPFLWMNPTLSMTHSHFRPRQLSLPSEACILRPRSYIVLKHHIALPEVLGPAQHAALPWTATCRTSWTWFLWKQTLWSESCCWRTMNIKQFSFLKDNGCT